MDDDFKKSVLKSLNIHADALLDQWEWIDLLRDKMDQLETKFVCFELISLVICITAIVICALR